MSDERKALTREAILAADDLKVEEVDVPEWGGVAYVRIMTGHERDTFDEQLGGQGLGDFRARVLAHCVCTADGAKIFEEEDVKQLTLKSSKAIERLYEVAGRLNGLRGTDVDALEKNSESVPNG